MDIELLRMYIYPEVLILVPVLYLIGLFLRQTPNVPYWIDVWVKLVISIVVCFFLIGYRVDAFIQAVLVAGGSSLMKDMIDRTVQGVQRGKNDDPESF